MKKKLTLSVLLCCIPFSSFALFCPTNFKQINIGDSTQTVIATCGKPDAQETKESKNEGPQEWSYFIPQTVNKNTGETMEGTLKTQITFNDQDKAVNISVNGIGVGNSNVCKNIIKLGDSRETIQAACGKPVLVNKNSDDTSQQPGKKITTFTYNTNPPVKLTFENDRLTERN